MNLLSKPVKKLSPEPGVQAVNVHMFLRTQRHFVSDTPPQHIS